MSKGRPIFSNIRQNVVEILYFMKSAYGYDINRNYREIFPKVTMRVIYYHLKKGTDIGEFKISKIQKEKGNYSWGGEAEKVYYSLGPNAKPTINVKVKEHFDKKRAGKAEMK